MKEEKNTADGVKPGMTRRQFMKGMALGGQVSCSIGCGSSNKRSDRSSFWSPHNGGDNHRSSGDDRSGSSSHRRIHIDGGDVTMMYRAIRSSRQAGCKD